MKKRIIGAIFNAIDEVNSLFPKDRQLEKSRDTILFDESGYLDSLGLINFIVATEQYMQEEFGVSISLADEHTMFQKETPFRTVETLAEYIRSLLEDKNANE